MQGKVGTHWVKVHEGFGGKFNTYLLSQVKITLNIYIIMFLKDILVVLQPYIF